MENTGYGEDGEEGENDGKKVEYEFEGHGIGEGGEHVRGLMPVRVGAVADLSDTLVLTHAHRRGEVAERDRIREIHIAADFRRVGAGEGGVAAE